MENESRTFIDITPQHLKTEEGAARVMKAIKENEDATASLAGLAKILYQALKSCCSMQDFKNVMSNEGDDLKEAIDWSNMKQEIMLRAICGR